MSLIDMRGIVKRFNESTDAEITVLPGCDFSMEPGEFVAVIGQSGSGKSTLMNIIGLLDRPTAGTYFLGGEDVSTYNDDALARLRADKLGFVFQNFNLIGRITALANVEMPMVYAGVPRRERSRRAAELLDLVGMSERASHLPNELSGGQKQRVAIARALANNPEVILADEPTGALDSQTGRLVMDLFHELNREHGTSIVFITHNPELAAECSRTVTMTDGVLK
ncbi:ABC transporter ATP-binding protein [Corynebacterium striatum]